MNLGEISDFAGLLLAAAIVFTGGMAIKGHKRARRIFVAGFAVLIFETSAVLLGGLNDAYFHLNFLDACLKAYFEWLNVYLVFIVGIMIVLAGLVTGLLARQAGGPDKY